jgi:hypothetical protein
MTRWLGGFRPEPGERVEQQVHLLERNQSAHEEEDRRVLPFR